MGSTKSINKLEIEKKLSKLSSEERKEYFRMLLASVPWKRPAPANKLPLAN